MEGLNRFVPRLRVSHLVAGLLIALSVVAGYLLAGWWFGAQDTTPLRQICARVDYLNSLQEALPEQRAPTKEMRNQFAMVVAQCREALGNPIEVNE